MGYESAGYGQLKLIKNGEKDRQRAEELLEEIGIGFDRNGGEYTVGFAGIKLYTLDGELKELGDYFTGSIEIQGEDPDDRWMLEIDESGAYYRQGRIVYGKQERFNLETMEVENVQ